ncbi:alpha/beta hydrolase [Demequina sp. NBRC 110054]|uniref:alpha/beta hydrolase n=1 Tax=Demequina sp. NBRC 110054 TaxID=1570343 RepID=UPI000A05F0A1|nr:alpha/beta hydrolase [Demequina sp. NBRC 110054]
MPLDPDIARIIDWVNAQKAAATEPPTIEQIRQQMADWREGAFGIDVVEGIDTEDVVIPASGGPVPARIYRPEGVTQPCPTIVYAHGGSWVMGSVEIYDPVTRRIAREARAVVVSIDYRLAPEHPFPAGWEDARDSILWAHEHIEELGGDAEAVVIAGDSAGGNFGSSLSVWARDAGVKLGAQLLIYPSCDLSKRYPSMDDLATGYLLETPPVDFPDRAYLVDPDLRWDPIASPLLSESLADLAPAVIVTAEFDPIKDHGTVLRDAYLEAGVTTVHREYAGLIHGFVSAASSPAAMAAIDDFCAELVKVLESTRV